MPLWQAIILGAVQGLTEFLPISSTAHLALIPWAFGWRDPGLTFDVALHVGTLAAVLIYFWKTWIDLFSASLRSLLGGRSIVSSAGSGNFAGSAKAANAANGANSLKVDRVKFTDSSEDFADGRLLWLLVLATIPAGVIGLLFEKQVETTLRSPLVMGSTLITVAFLMAYADRMNVGTKNLRALGLWDAMVVGCSQALALIPGVSRSGITITSALFMRFQRDTAARFSFLLSTPIIAGACLKKLIDIHHEGLPPDMMAPFVGGAIVSALVGYATIAFFIKFLQFGTFRIFVYYRVIIGIMVLALATFYRLNLNP
jgi:undecaprenyl-diphosphatase